MPLVAVALSDGSRLARLIILKSLMKQMHSTMMQRLGGLVDRPIYMIPFSRGLHLDSEFISQAQGLHESCLAQRGTLLAQPEHILSFKLIGIDRLVSGDFQVAAPLLKSQQWLQDNVRDVLDESDELLDVKFQLIYTLGAQRLMDAQPDRWLVAQNLFGLIRDHVPDLERKYPDEIEVSYDSKASFPRLRLLSSSILQNLLTRLRQDVVDSKFTGINLERYSSQVKLAIHRFLQDSKITTEDCQLLKESFGERLAVMQRLLILRGYLVYKILAFVLRNKRWSVNYGLHPVRCFLAVPYRAKGIPAPTAEFGHPDVVVALTFLSYYYSGLTDGQLRKALELLERTDDPRREWASWVIDCPGLPDKLRDWTAINLDDDRMCFEELFPRLKYSKKAIDFFLTNVVFPKEGKEFDEKLSTSGWDLVSTHSQHITTGFSGTNDNRFMLPLSICQQDLPELKHTSGQVLDFLLRDENLQYHCAQDDKGGQISTDGLLRILNSIDVSVRVFIDVGAQVLDTTNRDFVKLWMDIRQDVKAGIYFDEDDNIMVLTRDLKDEKLSVSSFYGRLEQCVVYLDEVHTRGTDLKLPATARAAVTLGPKLTKDRLVQGNDTLNPDHNAMLT